MGQQPNGGEAHTVLISNRLADGHGSLLVRVLEDQDLSQLYAEPDRQLVKLIGV